MPISTARIVALAATILLGACAIEPPVTAPSAMCNFTRHNLEVEVPVPTATESEGAASAAAAALAEAAPTGDSFRDALLRSLAPTPDAVAASESMLFLSGGSQNGAFGAGYLHGWREQRRALGAEGLPRFRVVTGISTGAILSTWAFIGDTDTLVNSYRISREGEILQPFVSGRAGDFRRVLAMARRGAVGDLIPLRDVLRDNLTPETFAAVARAARVDGRRLFIGAVDVDTGKAVAFDMTEMAGRYVDATSDERRELVEDCYVEAIIASSAVPLAARPVFIDNRMYIDGGARFGLFSNEIGEVLEAQARLFAPQDRPRYFVIVNGDLELSPVCGKADPALCRPDAPTGGLEGAHRDWSLDSLGFRSVSILINQGYRFSAARLKEQADRLGIEMPPIARIEADLARHEFALNDHPVLGSGRHRCPEWREIDRAADAPLEFHPRFMHCLVDYGIERGRRDGWASLP